MDKNAIFLDSQEFNEKFAALKTEFRRHMNGEASSMMAKQNVRYSANYGVSQQHIKEISAMFEFNIDECKRLWASNIREAMLVAAIQLSKYNADIQLLTDIATSITSADMAEQVTYFLFGKIENIDKFIERLIINNNTYSFGICYQTAGRAMQLGKNILDSTTEILLAKLITHEEISLTEFRAISLFLRQLIRTDIGRFDIINKTLKQLQTPQQSMVRQFFDEIEIEKSLLSV